METSNRALFISHDGVVLWFKRLSEAMRKGESFFRPAAVKCASEEDGEAGKKPPKSNPTRTSENRERRCPLIEKVNT